MKRIAQHKTDLRFMLYGHDGRGLGHIMRMCNLAAALKKTFPRSSVLCVSGSPEVPQLLSQGIDYIKLPAYRTILRARGTSAIPDTLRCSMGSFVAMRSAMLYAIAAHYRPQVSIIDFLPMGKKEELRDCLLKIKKDNIGAKIILGLRGIIFSDLKTKRDYWTKQNVLFLKKYYDNIFIYADPRVAPLSRLAMPESLKKMARYTGYVGQLTGKLKKRRPDFFNPEKKKLLFVSGGSGWHSSNLLKNILFADKIVKKQIPHETWIVTGPKISDREFTSLQRIMPRQERPFLLKFTPDYMKLFLRADAYIGRAGYNSIVEVLTAGKPAVFIGLDKTEGEQLTHLASLNKFLPLTYLAESDADIRCLVERLLGLLNDSGLRNKRRRFVNLNCDGAKIAARFVKALLSQ